MRCLAREFRHVRARSCQQPQPVARQSCPTYRLELYKICTAFSTRNIIILDAKQHETFPWVTWCRRGGHGRASPKVLLTYIKLASVRHMGRASIVPSVQIDAHNVACESE